MKGGKKRTTKGRTDKRKAENARITNDNSTFRPIASEKRRRGE